MIWSLVSAPSMDCSGGELSDSGSSGYWSVGHAHRSPAPSSPEGEADGGMAMPPDEGLDVDLDQVLFEEPAPRRRRVSGRRRSFKGGWRQLYGRVETVQLYGRVETD